VGVAIWKTLGGTRQGNPCSSNHRLEVGTPYLRCPSDDDRYRYSHHANDYRCQPTHGQSFNTTEKINEARATGRNCRISFLLQ
jgi:hypothetical protein